MGDFNAKIRDERVEDVVGPSDIGTVNGRGSKVIELCQINDFTITNTGCENHPKRQWTWKNLGDRSSNKIENSLIQKRFRCAVKHRNHCRELTVIQIIFQSCAHFS
ncbi:craniofacial development protein 2-like protein [Plakobranchus ocellatus]|uniref:Craniofacial development protein 2-like protein n=1 Tax=Plakobranchus ocellatus TaxID=259542 RepID=A0AAV3YEN1_9GAST|nr:craniofacial development protein 2-like protein [Plakobranchus ocellatus]